MVDNPGVNYARLCIPYVGAVALQRGAVGLADFQPDRLREKRTAELASRITVEVRDVSDPNALVPQRIEIKTMDGSNFAIEMEEVIGSPEKPLSRDLHLGKFRQNWQNGAHSLKLEHGEQLIDIIDKLEELNDCREITKLLVPE